MFRSLDTDGDNKLSYSEFLTGATDMTQLINKKNLRVAFNLFDLDGDGKVTVEELAQRFVHGNFKGNALGLSQGENQGEGFWGRMMEEFDEDGDGKISFDEFYDNMDKLLTKVIERR